MPKLWILNHYAVGPGESGGTRHFDLARELVKMGWDVSIFAASVNHIMRRETHLQPGEKIKKEVHDGVSFFWLRTPVYYANGPRRIWNMLVYTISVLRNAWGRERPEIIIGSSVHLFAAFAAYILARRHRCRFIFEVRDLWPQAFIEIFKISEYNPAIWLLRRLEVFLYRKAEKIIVLLPRANEYIERFGIPKEKIFYIPNGVYLSRYQESTFPFNPQLSNTLDSLAGKFIAIYAGSLGPVNGLDTLLDAAGLLQLRGDKQAHFLFVGNGAQKKRLQQRVVDEDLANVTFIDPVPKDYVPMLLRRANIGIHGFQDLPVFKWGVSPNKVFDYMAAGLPVLLLCSYTRDNPVDISGGGMVLPPGEAETLAQVIIELAASPERCAVMGKKALKYVEQVHSMEALGRRLALILSRNAG
ncbi:putative glycosyl transferase [Pelotomaculum schinkii]|uniref:Putative glycosyl transferase n=1 Tax=Pelotomaculum schinkii TaxID=78350 RepID=A0A4Y7RCA7_9FIRM|nr:MULTISPECIES: glycosyltransferase family 4 protein [Pelotomaculum]TEB06614.1 putative glycosyl transferase [Pelotomaculum schinkii]TEB17591.1 putative glycosyl transferase [Pelotomaculum sp. FP]